MSQSSPSPPPAFWHVQIERVRVIQAPPERARVAFTHCFGPADHARPTVLTKLGLRAPPEALRMGAWVGASVHFSLVLSARSVWHIRDHQYQIKPKTKSTSASTNFPAPAGWYPPVPPFYHPASTKHHLKRFDFDCARAKRHDALLPTQAQDG